MTLNVSVIGLGYLGATHAVAMSKLGHNVIGIEPNQAKIDSLQSGHAGFFEPGLDEELKIQIASGRLTFKSTHDESSRNVDVHFICVGTPQLDGSLVLHQGLVQKSQRGLS